MRDNDLTDVLEQRGAGAERLREGCSVVFSKSIIPC
jgi:hypothetical protein